MREALDDGASGPFRIEFWAAGQPGTKGSAKAFVVGGRARITNDAGEKAKAWAAVVSAAAHTAMAGRPVLRSPVVVQIIFYLARPKSHFHPPTRNRSMPVLRRDAALYVASKPDGDKLERCTWDALTRVVFADDSQVVTWHGCKKYSLTGETGAMITVSTLETAR